MDSILKNGESISLSLGIPVLVFCLLVVIEWRKSFFDIIKKYPNCWTAACWFTVGVTIGFSGEFLDNLFWHIAWTLSYIDSPYKDPVFNMGVLPNIPFRQLCSLLAAYCHVRSAIVFFDVEQNSRRISKLNLMMVYSVLAGVVYTAALTMFFTPA